MIDIKITEEELLERKSRIIHNAFQLFCKDGIDRVSMKEIAAKANVSEKSIYRYFGTKKDLIVEMIDILWDEIILELYTAVDETYHEKTGYQQIEHLLQCFRHLFEEHSNYVLFSYDYKLFLIRHNYTITEPNYSDTVHRIYSMYIQAIEKGIQDGSIHVAHRTPKDVYYTIWGLMRGYIVKIVIYDRIYSTTNLWLEQFDTVCDLILGGLKSGML